jgi:Xaa-Pro dipeptidase
MGRVHWFDHLATATVSSGHRDVNRVPAGELRSGASPAKRLAEALKDAGAAGALLSRPEDVCYATGFEVPPPIDAGAAFAYGPALALVAADGSAILLAPGAYQRRAGELSRADETVLVPSFGHFEPVDGRRAFRDAVASALRSLGIGPGARIAVDEATLPAEVAGLLAGLVPDAPLVDAAPITRRARLVKTPSEIELLRRAAAAADAGHEALLELAAPGRNELEVMGDVLTRVDRAAGQPLPWAGELVSGARTGIVSYPGGPVDRELEAGDTVLMDLSVRYRGYWADCTNTLVLGEPTEAQLRHFRAARDACEAAIETLRPGRRAREAHAAAAAAFGRHGLEPAHYTGHQVGCSVNEDPRLVRYDETPIEAGMVFAVEPGVYGGLEVGTGARAERVVLVTEDGPELLTRFRWGLD